MKSLFGILVLACAVSTSVAQQRLNLDMAVETAMARNHELLGANHDLESARWGKFNAVTNFLPKVEVGLNVTRIDNETLARANSAVDFIRSVAGPLGITPDQLANVKPFAYRDTYGADLTVVQPIYNGGAEIVGLNAANAMRDKSEFSLLDTEQDVIARVRISYLTVLKAEELVSLSKESLARTQRWLDATQRKAESGMRTKTDVLRWEVQRASDEGMIVNAENYASAARLQLNDVMGVDLATVYVLDPITFSDSLGTVTDMWKIGFHQPIPSDEGDLLTQHPAMQMMEANLRLADVNIEKSWVNFQPRVNLAFQYGLEKKNVLTLDGIRPWALALTVQWPIFNSLGDYANLEKARAEYQRTDEQVTSFRRGLSMQSTNARLNVQSAKKRTEIARKAEQEGLDVLNSISRRYDAGGASNVDLIDVQTAYNSAKTNRITAEYDYAIASIQLSRATGTVVRSSSTSVN